MAVRKINRLIEEIQRLKRIRTLSLIPMTPSFTHACEQHSVVTSRFWYKILFSNRLHITGTFPSSNVLVRNPEGAAVRSLYLVNDIVKAVIQNNNYEKIRLTAAGTKVFAKQEAGKGSDTQFRILGEGLPVILPYINPPSIITANIATLRVLVESHYPLCSKFDEPFRGVIEGRGVCYFKLFTICNSRNLVESGSHIVKFLVGSMNGVKYGFWLILFYSIWRFWHFYSLAHDLVLPIWKSNVSLTLMIDKKAKRQFYCCTCWFTFLLTIHLQCFEPTPFWWWHYNTRKKGRNRTFAAGRK